MIGIPTRTGTLDHRPLRVWHSMTIRRLLQAANMFDVAWVLKSGASLWLGSRQPATERPLGPAVMR